MQILPLVLLFALAFGVVLILSKPLFEPRRDNSASESAKNAALHGERERLLAALQELDFDHGLGKMSAEDYTAQRSDLMSKAVEIEKQIEEVSSSRGG